MLLVSSLLGGGYPIYFSMRVLLCSCAAEACCASVGGVEWSAYWREVRDRHDQQLGDAVTCLNLEGFRVGVVQHDLQVTGVTGVYNAGDCECGESVFRCVAGAWAEEADLSFWDCYLGAEVDGAPLSAGDD